MLVRLLDMWIQAIFPLDIWGLNPHSLKIIYSYYSSVINAALPTDLCSAAPGITDFICLMLGSQALLNY